jgi:hypothetical protein
MCGQRHWLVCTAAVVGRGKCVAVDARMAVDANWRAAETAGMAMPVPASSLSPAWSLHPVAELLATIFHSRTGYGLQIRTLFCLVWLFEKQLNAMGISDYNGFQPEHYLLS